MRPLTKVPNADINEAGTGLSERNWLTERCHPCAWKMMDPICKLLFSSSTPAHVHEHTRRDTNTRANVHTCTSLISISQHWLLNKEENLFDFVGKKKRLEWNWHCVGHSIWLPWVCRPPALIWYICDFLRMTWIINWSTQTLNRKWCEVKWRWLNLVIH